MVKQIQKTRVIFLVLLGVLIVLALVAVTSQLIPITASAQKDTVSVQQNSPEGGINCNIAEIAVLDNRIHILCSPGVGAIIFFAASTDSSSIAHTNQYLTLANTAYALGKPILIYYDDNPAANPPGCLTSNCRRIWGVIIKP